MSNFAKTTLKKILEIISLLEPMKLTDSSCLKSNSSFNQNVLLMKFYHIARSILNEFSNDPLCVKVMLDIEHKKHFLLGHLAEKPIPRTTNLIESFNSHLNGTLKTIKGFEDFLLL